MKARVISSSNKRNTSMIVIKYLVDGHKRSETRHCQWTTDHKLRGYILDNDKILLQQLQLQAAELASEKDLLDRALDIKAKKTSKPNVSVMFTYDKNSDNILPAYAAVIGNETRKVKNYIALLIEEIEPLRLQYAVRKQSQFRARRLASPI